MENTLENKAKFFAQHLNQKVYYQNRVGNIVQFYLSSGNFEKQVWIVSLEDENFEQNELSCSANVKECQLILKPLSSITDEEILEYKKFQQMEKMEDSYFIKCFKNDLITENFSSLFSDYFRSKGFAIEWMELSVDKQIKYGWIKLKI